MASCSQSLTLCTGTSRNRGQLEHEQQALDKLVAIDLLKKFGRTRPLEYGCGLGRYTKDLYDALGAAAGIDISATSIEKARLRFPGPDFFVGDILTQEALSIFRPDSLVLSQVTWYILERLAAFKAILSQHSGLGFVHLLQVYAPGEQQYGREYSSDLETIRAYWLDTIDVLEWGETRRAGDTGGRTFFYGRVR